MNDFKSTFPEARMAPVWLILGLVVCILWAVTIGIWSMIAFGFIFSLWKRSVIIAGMKNADQFADSIERSRLELRHLNSKLGFITALQYGTWLLFWVVLREGA